MRRSLLLVSALLLLSGSTARADTIDWRTAPFFHADRGNAYVVTSEKWRGAKRVVNVSPSDFRDTPAGSYADQPDYVWAPACSTKTQTVRFSLDVTLPGPPAVLGVSLYSRSWLKRNPVTALELRVNGGLALRTKGAHRVKLGESARELFRHGRNDLELVAVKARSARCNSDTFKDGVGVALELLAEFKADLTVAAAQPKRGSACCVLTFDVGNRGPSWAIFGSFHVEVRIDFELESAQPAVFPAGACKVFRFGYTAVQCSFPDLRPGGQVHVQIRLDYKEPAGPFDVPLDISWNGFGYFDPNGPNGQGRFQLSYCAPTC